MVLGHFPMLHFGNLVITEYSKSVVKKLSTKSCLIDSKVDLIAKFGMSLFELHSYSNIFSNPANLAGTSSLILIFLILMTRFLKKEFTTASKSRMMPVLFSRRSIVHLIWSCFLLHFVLLIIQFLISYSHYFMIKNCLMPKL